MAEKIRVHHKSGVHRHAQDVRVPLAKRPDHLDAGSFRHPVPKPRKNDIWPVIILPRELKGERREPVAHGRKIDDAWVLHHVRILH